MDKRASATAKRAIENWIKPLPSDSATVSSALVEIFDRLFTQPLLGASGFFRSAMFSVTVMAIFFYEAVYVNQLLFTAHKLTLISGGILIDEIVYYICSNIASDYISLFAVRKFLVLGGQRPIAAMLLGPIVGGLVVGACNFVAELFWQATNIGVSGVLENAIQHTIVTWGNFFRNPFDYTHGPNFFVIPALAIHLWLPLLAISMLLLRLLNAIIWAVGKAQWFFKGGSQHPLEMIGYVAALLVFVITGILTHWHH